ncbi:MAG TPA: PAS domain S-box protein [Chloroflexota bacterium]|nr:PAS domain S-box protein [Chloroflexota bacterium]
MSLPDIHPADNGRPTALSAGHERVLALLAAGAPPADVRAAVDALVQEQAAERQRVEAELREREGQYRAIFESTLDGLVINDLTTGRIVEANSAAHRMHGYTYEEFLGLHPTAFIHPDYHAAFAAFLDAARAGGQFRVRAVDVRRDGTPFHVDVRGTTFTYRGKPHVLGVIRDVTEQQKTRQALERHVAERTRELSALLEVAQNVTATLELEPLLGLILDQLKLVVAYEGASIFALERDELVVVASRRGDPAAGRSLLGIRFPIAGGAAHIWQRLADGQPVNIPDMYAPTPLAVALRGALGPLLHTPAVSYIRTWLAVPLPLKERIIGMLTVSSSATDAYTPRDATLMMAIASQAAVAIENARLYQQAQTLAALEERQRLARELHDSVSQALYGIALGARTARTLLDRDPAQVADPLDYVLSLADAGLAEMRALIFELRPESLAQEGLVAALEKQVAALRARHGIDVQVTLCDEPAVPLELKEPIYRIAQEALHNTVKHARARHVELRLECSSEEITLEVADDGVGFDPAAEYPGHLGLRSMRERAAALGGTLRVESARGLGSRLWAIIPTRRSA